MMKENFEAINAFRSSKASFDHDVALTEEL